MIRVKITTKMKKDAADYENEVLRNLKRKGRNLTGLEVAHRYRNGFVGELVFGQLLKDHGKRFNHIVKTDGAQSGGDFYVWTNNVPVQLDVKTQSRMAEGWIGEPASKFIRHRYIIWVGVRLDYDNSSAEVWGYLPFTRRGDMKLRMLKVESMTLPLFKLTSINILLGKLDNEDTKSRAPVPLSAGLS